jgi:hypothetical protein
MPTTARDVMDLFTQVVPYLNDQQLSNLKKVLERSRPPPNTLPVVRRAQQSRHVRKRASLQRFIPIAKAIVHLVETGHTLCLRWGNDKEITIQAHTDDSHPNQPLCVRRTYTLYTTEPHTIGALSVKPPCTLQKLSDRFFMTILYIVERLSVVTQQIQIDSFGPTVAQFGYPLLPVNDQQGFLHVVNQSIGQQQYTGRRFRLDTSATRPSWIGRLTI